MTAGVFNLGRKWILDKAFRDQLASASLHVGMYTNTRGTLTNRSVLSDIAACAGSGYAPIPLAAVDWSTSVDLGETSDEDAVIVTRPDVVFTASAGWGVVTGAYLFDQSNGVAVAWRDGDYDYDMLTGAKYLVDWISELI